MTTTRKSDATVAYESTIRLNTGHKAEVVERLQAAVAKDALYALEWAESDARQLAQIQLWETVKAIAERDGNTPAIAVQAVVDEATRSLLNNWYRPSSTSAFSNAVSMAKAEAAARFVEEARGLLNYMQKVSERELAEAEAATVTAVTAAELQAEAERDRETGEPALADPFYYGGWVPPDGPEHAVNKRTRNCITCGQRHDGPLGELGRRALAQVPTGDEPPF